MRIALYQPDIPQNAGTILRMSVCFGLPVDIIEPCGFIWNSKELKRAGMDYLDKADVTRHMAWETFFEQNKGKRLVLLTTKASVPYTDFAFDKDDILLFGRESAGVPENVHNAVSARIRIPMKPNERSLNLALSCAVATTEAMRQTGLFNGLS